MAESEESRAGSFNYVEKEHASGGHICPQHVMVNVMTSGCSLECRKKSYFKPLTCLTQLLLRLSSG